MMWAFAIGFLFGVLATFLVLVVVSMIHIIDKTNEYEG